MTKMAQVIEAKSLAFCSKSYQLVFCPSIKTPVTFSDLSTAGNDNKEFIIYYNWIHDQIQQLDSLKLNTSDDEEGCHQIQSEINGHLGIEKLILDDMITDAQRDLSTT